MTRNTGPQILLVGALTALALAASHYLFQSVLLTESFVRWVFYCARLAATDRRRSRLWTGPARRQLGVVVLQIVVLVMAVRRRRRGAVLPLTVHAIAVAAIAVFPVLAGLSVHAARALMFEAVTSTTLDPSEKSGAVIRSLGGQITRSRLRSASSGWRW